MKDKGLVIGAIAVVAVVIIGVVFMAKPKAAKPAAPAAATAKAGKVMPAPAKKALSKDMGGLTVKLQGANDKDLAVRIKAFKAVDSRSSVLVKAFGSNVMQELTPGAYDLELETMPAKIYKGIKVSKGRESVENLGRVTGTLEVKALNSAKKTASYPVRVLYAKTNVAAAGSANRPMEIVAGIYDIEIVSMPRQVRNDVRIDAGKVASVDIGTAGRLVVKAVSEEGKEVRGYVRVKKTENGELVTSSAANKPIELLPGSYMVESTSTPMQTKKDVIIKAGEETVVEFVLQAPPAPAPRPVAPPKPAAAAPAKKPGA
jgi:hypothetical protein